MDHVCMYVCIIRLTLYKKHKTIENYINEMNVVQNNGGASSIIDFSRKINSCKIFNIDEYLKQYHLFKYDKITYADTLLLY
jgi:hypothetical protein